MSIESILTSAKKKIGFDETYTQFDSDVTDYINYVFAILRQCGVGPEEGFMISDKSDEWTDFLEEGPVLSLVRVYIPSKVKIVFDPPTNSTALQALKDVIAECEFRLGVEVDPGESEDL